MISLARKNLLHEKLRFLISVGGVAFSVMLILIILALYRGWNEKLGRYVESVDADVWVLQNGATDMFHSTSLFPVILLDQLKNIDGVKRVDPVVGRRIPVEKDGKEVMMIMMGYDTKTGAGGPLKIVKGAAPQKGEIIIDEVMAKKLKVGVGDKLEIIDETFTIAGISSGGNVVTFQYGFMPIDDAREFMRMSDLINYGLVSFADGTDAQEMTDRIERNIPDVDLPHK